MHLNCLCQSGAATAKTKACCLGCSLLAAVCPCVSGGPPDRCIQLSHPLFVVLLLLCSSCTKHASLVISSSN
jgi:hypothetical protein